tara:strand:+ start:6394 stop:6588 length:195 start_codon:yes stop_codon:yes gene_type:complete
MDLERAYIRLLDDQIVQKNDVILSGNIPDHETYKQLIALRNQLLTTREEFTTLLARREGQDNVE